MKYPARFKPAVDQAVSEFKKVLPPSTDPRVLQFTEEFAAWVYQKIEAIEVFRGRRLSDDERMAFVGRSLGEFLKTYEK